MYAYSIVVNVDLKPMDKDLQTEEPAGQWLSESPSNSDGCQNKDTRNGSLSGDKNRKLVGKELQQRFYHI